MKSGDEVVASEKMGGAFQWEADPYAENVYLCVQIVRGVPREEGHPNSLSIAYILITIYGRA